MKLSLKNGKILEAPVGTTLLELSKLVQQDYASAIVIANVDNEVRDLQYKLFADCEVEFFEILSEQGLRVYERSLIFLLVRAVEDLYPSADVKIKYTIGSSLYGELHGITRINSDTIFEIEKKMRDLVAENIPFLREVVPIANAIKLFQAENKPSKARLLKYRDQETAYVYSCGDSKNYFYSYMVPSTGYLKTFDLKYYMPGFVICLPQANDFTKTAVFKESPKLYHVFQNAEKWTKVLMIDDVGSFNDAIMDGKGEEIVWLAEALQEKLISKIADEITNSSDEKRLICIAGPSSSGKTTTAKRLSIQLRVNGLSPISISLDDYFVEREKTPLDEFGNYDFESLYALDLELFNKQLKSLIEGEEVYLPSFNFITGRRELLGRNIKINIDQPIIIEGIHALNEVLTSSIPRHYKYKIYISPLTQMNLDEHNRIPTTDARKIRRIVRDNRTRNAGAEKTLSMWASVRRGEDKNIFPFQEDADVLLNTHLMYELAVLKPFAKPLLDGVPRESPYYPEAKRLSKFLSFFVDLDSSLVPSNSIVREFVGNSCFYQE
ncbi:MAG: TGS domain-containing protein [Clostridia bacterium]